jgi:hypothetical protein
MKATMETNVSHYCRNFFLPVALILVACLGAGTAQTSSDALKPRVQAIATERDGQHAMALMVSQDSAKPAQPAIRDVSHDFDFIYGKWRMPNHRLVKRLAGSHEWTDFVSCTAAINPSPDHKCGSLLVR